VNTLREALKSENFALTAKLSMARGQNAHDVIDEARLLAKSVDAIRIPDSALARPHISSIAGGKLPDGPELHIGAVATAFRPSKSISPVFQSTC